MSNVTLHLGDCLEYMRTMPDKSVDAVITDPPYGCGKADWDDFFPTAWYEEARRIGKMVVIITGSAVIKDSVFLVGNDFVDCIAAWNKNGMTRGPLGFGNWISAVVAVGRPQKQIQNYLSFVVMGEMPNHPSPKPIEYMNKLLRNLTQDDYVVFDPFMGSGTTGVAAVQLGRNFIGCEINPDYFAIAERRIKQAQEARQLEFA